MHHESIQTKAGRLQFIAAALFVASIGVQARLAGNLYPAELALAALLVARIYSGVITRPPRWLMVSGCVWALLVATALMFSDAPEHVLRAARNVSAPLLALVVFSMVRFNQAQWVGLLRLFVLTGTCLAALGVHQAIVGSEASATVFTLGLVSEDSEYLLDVIQWKLMNMSNANLSLGRDLAIGLHTYSNNFGEYLVYVAAAIFGLRRMRAIKAPAFLASSGLVLTAIVLSGSRTCLIGWAMLLAYFVTVSIRSMQLRIMMWILAAVTALVVVALEAIPALIFGYDGLGTVDGRTMLNMAAISTTSQSLENLAFGSNIGDFRERFIQSPHNALLFLALTFGVPAALGGAYLVGRILLALWRANGGVRGAERAFVQQAFVATVWMVLYSMTWSVVEDALSGFMWALFLAPALPMLKARTAQRLISPRRFHLPRLVFRAR